MKHLILINLSAALLLSACQNAAPIDTKPAQSAAERDACIRTVMKLDEGTWAYMGTIARGNGKFRTYETTSVHAAAGPDTWSFRSYGGDVGEEEGEETSYAKLVGNAITPVENDKLMHDQAVTYVSCKGPDAEGRYEAKLSYRLPHMDDRMLDVDNITWTSEHGSYYVEDIIDDTGRIIARRSGVNTPVAE